MLGKDGYTRTDTRLRPTGEFGQENSHLTMSSKKAVAHMTSTVCTDHQGLTKDCTDSRRLIWLYANTWDVPILM